MESQYGNIRNGTYGCLKATHEACRSEGTTKNGVQRKRKEPDVLSAPDRCPWTLEYCFSWKKRTCCSCLDSWSFILLPFSLLFFLVFSDCSCISCAPFPFAASVYFSNFLVLRYSIGHTPYHRNQTVNTVRLWEFPNSHGSLNSRVGHFLFEVKIINEKDK